MSDDNYILMQLAEFSAGIDCSRLPEAVNKKIIYCILDALECCLEGNGTDPRSMAAWEYVKDRWGNSTAFARGVKLKISEAAFYNTVTGAVSSRNDISKPGSCHAGSIVVPTAFALAEEIGCTGKQLMEAVLIGYETMIRLGIAVRLSGMPKAFRSTAVLAPFGAAFTTAKLLGTTAEETANAASFACHSASGFNNWVSEGTGEDVLQNGWGARNGIEAALLARTGLPSAKGILEDQDGFLAAFSALDHQDMITAELGRKWHILDVDYKPMGSCLKLIAPCQAAKKLLGQISDISQIRKIRIGVAEKTLHHAGTRETEVNSQIQAIMSIPFGVVNVLVFGDDTGIQWNPPYRKEVLELMKRCEIEEERELTELFPGKRGARVTVTMYDKKEYSLLQEDVEGLTENNIESMFEQTMSRFYGTEKAVELKRIFLNLKNEKNLERVFQILNERSI